MWAGIHERDATFVHIGARWYTEAYGHDDPVEVTVTEHPDGPYWAWLDARHPDGDYPEMIQAYASLYGMQFPAGAALEEERGRGRTIRVTIEPAEGHGRVWSVTLTCGCVIDDVEEPVDGDEWRCDTHGERAMPRSWNPADAPKVTADD